MAYLYRIGATEVGLTLLSTLNIVAPKHTYKPYARTTILGNGRKKGLGYPEATWHWDYVTKDQRDAIRAYVDNLSKEVFITTRVEDDSYADFSAIMNWVEEEEKDAGRRFDLNIVFTHLIEV